MPILMPFGKYTEKSVEQIALTDYKYFVWAFDEHIPKKPELWNRWRFVEYVANNFVPQINCASPECKKPANFISIYQSAGVRISDTSFVYCSSSCLDTDPKVTPEKNKISLQPIKFRTALSTTKHDTNGLVKVIAECMGLNKGRQTQESLEDFFNTRPLHTPFY